MRPVDLTVEGLACFKDKQEGELATLDLFAISGPTGAGKSTLLDAVIFALYGEVPRVNKHNRSEMIAAARDRVSVVLDFDVGADRYRIARALRRNGNHGVRLEKHDGKDFSINLADQVGTTGEKVVEVLGLEATAFMQAVVLPQGEFAKFLKAQPRDRRNMLRSLLRLDVYERMRDQAQSAASTKKSKVDSLRKILADEYKGVDDAALADLETRHEKVTAQLEGLRKKRGEAQQGLDRLRGQHSRTVELRQNEAWHKELQGRAEEMTRMGAQLEASARAIPLLSLLDEAAREAKNAASAHEEAEKAKTEQQKAQTECAEKSTALKAAENAAKVIPALRQQIAQLNQVVGRLPEVEQLVRTVARQTADMEALAKDLAELELAIQVARATQTEQATAVAVAKEALQAAAYDADLDGLLQTVRTQAIELSVSRRSAAEAKEELSMKRKAVHQLQASIEPLEKDAQAAAGAAEEARKGVHTAEEALHNAHQLDAANYLREALQPDQPCLVCEQTVASPPPRNLNPEVDAAKNTLETAKKLLGEADVKVRKSQEALTRAQANVAAEQKSLAELEERCSGLEAKVSKDDGEIRAALVAHMADADFLVEAWVETRTASFAESRRAHERAKDDRDKAERALEKAKNGETSTRERVAEKQASQKRLEEEREVSQQRLTKLRDEIAAVSQSEDPVADAAAVAKQIEGLEGALKTAVTEAATSKNRLTTAKEASRLTTKAANKACEDAATRSRRRDQEIARAGFAGEVAVRAALLDEATRTDMVERVRKYDQECHAVEQRIGILKEELGDVRVSDDELDAAAEVAKDLNAKVEKQHGEQKTLEEQVGRMKERLERSKKMRKELETEEQALRVYNQLAGDLRSDKFQAYVLEETFTALVQGASARLLSLTGERYSLLFKDGDILVVDNDNAGETRISDTLSGGETFLTSLSLALELSDQVQRAAGAVNLDSLFIDEGFGTLDPDTLALVSETIHSLRVGGRMVGIITHIPELRDEFTQQVIVTKHQGFSTVEVHGGAHAA